MTDKINYGVFPNPLPDAEGKTTYQVRHIPNGTMSEKGFLAHLKYHNTYNTTTMMSSLCVLRDEIIHDEEGNPIKPHFTDPNKITANDVEVQGVSFTPDPSFVKALKSKISTQNKYGRGAAGRNKPYTREQIVEFLDNHLREHHSITRKQMQYALNITEYRAQKWLDELTAEEFSKYYCKKQGTTYVYYRYGWE